MPKMTPNGPSNLQKTDTESVTPLPRQSVDPVSIQTVAKQAGVSIATISRVLNGNESKVSQATRERVMAIVNELGYRPSRVGSALRSGRSRLVALMVPEPTNAYNGAIANSVEASLRAHGKILLFCNTQESPLIQDELLQEMRAQMVSGIIMLGAVESEGIDACIASGEPIVFVNRRPAKALPGTFVGIDNRAAGIAVARHFLSNGFRDIWLVHGPLSSSATSDRVNGFLTQVHEQEPDVRISQFAVDRSRMDAGYAIAKQILSRKDKPSAVFCTTDELAYGFFKRCCELGINVPSELHIFGFDGNPLNSYLAPWLSTIRVPYERFGEAVTEKLELQWSQVSQAGMADTIFAFAQTIATDRATINR